jgi:hypothetical protein
MEEASRRAAGRLHFKDGNLSHARDRVDRLSTRRPTRLPSDLVTYFLARYLLSSSPKGDRHEPP